MEEKEEKKVKESIFEVVQYPTQHTPVIRNPKGEIITEQHALAQVLNELTEIKKLLG